MVKLCQNSRDATRVSQGVLIGSGQLHFLLRGEFTSIKEYFDSDSCIIGEQAESYCSAFLPMRSIAVGGKLYRSGSVVVAKQQNT